MTVHLPEPLLVEDANEAWWRTRPPEHRAAVSAWLAQDGIDVTDLMRIEVYLVDAPFARLVFRVRGSDAKVLFDVENEEVVTRTETVLLSSLPPRLE